MFGSSESGTAAMLKSWTFNRIIFTFWCPFHLAYRFRNLWELWKENLRSSCSRVTLSWNKNRIGAIIFGLDDILSISLVWTMIGFDVMFSTKRNKTKKKKPKVKTLHCFFVCPACKSIRQLARELRSLTGRKAIRSQCSRILIRRTKQKQVERQESVKRVEVQMSP